MTPRSSPCHQHMPVCSRHIRHIYYLKEKSQKFRVLEGHMVVRSESRLQRVLGKLWQKFRLHRAIQINTHYYDN